MVRVVNYVADLPRAMVVFLTEVFNGRGVVGCEIGVQYGYNARSILQQLNIERLYLIDPYEMYEGYPADPRWGIVRGKGVAKKTLKGYEDRIVWIYRKSSDAVAEVQEALDFVYIDGCHLKRYVTEDIEKYYCLVRPGGYIGGHDYKSVERPKSYPIQVKDAVDEFVTKSGCDLTISTGPVPDWWVQK